jgi:hypothetical protein
MSVAVDPNPSMGLDHPFAVTLFPNFGAASKRQIVTTLREMVGTIAQTNATDKTDLPWLKLASFGESRTEKGSLRHNANVLEISGVEGDYDAEVVSLDEGRAMLAKAGLAAMLYTSPSHTAAKPRWRVLCPASKSLPPSGRSRLLERVNGALGGILSGESFTLSQSYYFGTVNHNPDHAAVLVAGRFVDLADDLDAGAIGKARKPSSSTGTDYTSAPRTFTGGSTPYGLKALENECGKIRNAPDGQKHPTLFKAALDVGRLVGGGALDEGTAHSALLGALSSIRGRCHDFGAAQKTLDEGFARGIADPKQVPPLKPRLTLVPPPDDIPWPDEVPPHLAGESDGQGEEYDPETGEVFAGGAQPLRDLPKRAGFDFIDPRDWTAPARPREWIVGDWIPRGVVTALYGDGGMGKSLLAQQLMTSVATGSEWLGLPVFRGRALGIMCEDDPDELHRRQEAINKGMGFGPGDLADLRYVSRVGFDNILMAFDGRDVGQLTQVFEDMDAACEAFRPDLLVCDTIADFFGGNENNRAQVRQFVQNSFGRLARKHGCGLLIAGHPSVAGIASGNGTGGSTAWNNTVRSRVYLSRPEGEDTNPDARLLSRKKANYAPKDAELAIIWKAGCFQLSDAAQAANLPDWAVISGILDMIELAWRSGMPLSNARQTRDSGRYLPAVACKRFDISETMAAKLVSDWLIEGHITVQTADAKTKTKGLKVVRRFDREA